MKSLLYHRHVVFTIVFLLSIVNTLFGQVTPEDPSSSPKNIKISSPNAASLGKIADIPVSYHTGIPNIDVPIYSISAGPIKLPISLSYHAGGLKVMEQSSWVGAGWSLNAGGMVTRTVRGLADDWTGTGQTQWYLSNTTGNAGGYYDFYLDGQHPNHPDYSMFGWGQLDGESDLYFFNFAGYSGKFYFRADGSAVVLPEQDVKIIPFFCNGSYTGCASQHELAGWTIITPDGTKYSFGRTDKLANNATPLIERTKTVSLVGSSISYNPIASWYLFHVESPDGVYNVDLNYVAEQYGYFSVALYPYAPTAGGTSTGWNLAKNLVNGLRLSSITFPNGTATFTVASSAREDLSSYVDNTIDNPNTDAKALQSIQISGGGICKIFDLNTSYFTDTHDLYGNYGGTGFNTNSYVSDKKKLKLNSVTERSCDNSIINPSTTFTYFDEASVPRALSLGQDHWGFFNGITTNQSLLPSYSLDGGATFSGGADREAHWPAMRAGALASITYPTGGKTSFEYEANNNGFTRSYYTYEKTTSVVDRSAGFDGVGGPGPKVSQSLNDGKYYIDLMGGMLPTGANASGTFHIENTSNAYSWGIAQGVNSTIIVDITPGTYDIWVSVTNPATGKGAQGTIYHANLTLHNDPTVIGGLRIYNISQSSDGDNPVVQHFDYNSGMSYYTYDKTATTLFDQNTGFGGTSSSTHNNLTLGGQYYVDLIGTQMNSNQVGTLHIGNYSYTILPGTTSSVLVGIPAGTYDTYVSVTNPLSGSTTTSKIFTAAYTSHADPTGSQGVLFSRPNYVAVLKNDLWLNPSIPAGTNNQNSDILVNTGCKIDNDIPRRYAYFLSSGSIHPMQTTQGSHIGYNRVKVSKDDGSYTLYNYYRETVNQGVELSEKIIDYTQCSQGLPTYPPAPLPFYPRRGELISQSMYNSADVLIKEIKYQSRYTRDTVGVPGVIVRPFGTYMPATEYEYKNWRKSMSSQLELIYNPLVPSQIPQGRLTETYYGSPYHHLPTRTTVWESVTGTDPFSSQKGKSLSDSYFNYSGDISLPMCGGAGTYDQTLLSALQAAKVYWPDNGCGTFNCNFTNWLTRNGLVTTAWKNYRDQRRTYFTNYNTCMTSSTNYSNASADLKPLIDLANRFEIAAPTETARYRDGSFMGSTYTVYQYPGASRTDIHPGTLFTISQVAPTTGVFTPLSFSNTAITKSGLYQQEEMYKFQTANLSEVTEKNGITTAYIWDASKLFPIVKAVGVTYNDLNTAYSAGGNYRAHTLLANAQVTSYTYVPLQGMTSQTDANNVTTYYTYDALWRLEAVKDNALSILKKIEYSYKSH